MHSVDHPVSCSLIRMLEREFQRDYGYIAQAVVACEERPLPCPPRLLDVFNDTAVITFPGGGLRKLPQHTWTAEPAEPRYEHCPDLEIVRRGESWRAEQFWGGCVVFNMSTEWTQCAVSSPLQHLYEELLLLVVIPLLKTFVEKFVFF